MTLSEGRERTRLAKAVALGAALGVLLAILAGRPARGS